MISKDDNNVVGFIKLLSSWKEAYTWKMTSFVSIKTLGGPRLLIGRVLFDTVKPKDDLGFCFESGYVIAGREIAKVHSGDINVCVDNAIEGNLVCEKKTFHLLLKDGNTLTAWFLPVYHPSVTFGPRLPSLIIRGSPTYELLSSPGFRHKEMLDWDLKSADQPFDNLDELFTHLGFPTSYQSGDSSTLEIIGISPTLIDADSRISAGSAQIKCRLAEAGDAKKLKFGYKVFHASSVERGSLAGDDFEWSRDASSRVGSASIPTNEAPLLQGFLSYDKIGLHQWWIVDPEKRLNLRYALHEVFDRELGFIRRFLLTPEGKQNRAFEHGMALLLTLLGFSVAHYGKLSNMDEGPDIIATTPGGNVGVVECTTSLLNAKDKLVKLAQRTILIKDQLNKTGHGYLSVLPIIVTALRKTEVEAGLEQAGENGIAVLCKENVEELLERVKLPPNPEAMFQEAQRLVPTTKESSSFETTK